MKKKRRKRGKRKKKRKGRKKEKRKKKKKDSIISPLICCFMTGHRTKRQRKSALPFSFLKSELHKIIVISGLIYLCFDPERCDTRRQLIANFQISYTQRECVLNTQKPTKRPN